MAIGFAFDLQTFLAKLECGIDAFWEAELFFASFIECKDESRVDF